MRDPKAIPAFVFGLVGSVFILVSLPFLIGLFFGTRFGYPPITFGPFGFFTAITSGVFVSVGAVGTLRNPRHGMAWGIVMVVFGATSSFGTGGVLVGFALAVTGGSLAIVVGTSEPGALPLAVANVRARTGCGTLLPKDFAHSPHCGHAVGGMKV